MAEETAGADREYANDSIVVRWESEYCIGAGFCTRGLPNVFRSGQRPWVHPNEASPDEIAEVILRCPSGALHFERLDGGPQEQPGEVTEATFQRGGPLYLRGRVRVTDNKGNVLREDTRVALCRCGQSQNKPFCDASHNKIDYIWDPPPKKKPPTADGDEAKA